MGVIGGLNQGVQGGRSEGGRQHGRLGRLSWRRPFGAASLYGHLVDRANKALAQARPAKVAEANKTNLIKLLDIEAQPQVELSLRGCVNHRLTATGSPHDMRLPGGA
jgi:hypothetical protein